jgi:hypothetical protein
MGEIAEDKDLAIERITPLKDYLPIVFLYVTVVSETQGPFYSPSPPAQLLSRDRHWE